MRKTLFVASLVIVIAGAAIAATVIAKSPKAKITKSAARATALALVPGGVVKSSELETENHRLIYSFDIAQPNKSGIEEVQISAVTGKLVNRHHESPAKEASEAVADAKVMKATKAK